MSKIESKDPENDCTSLGLARRRRKKALSLEQMITRAELPGCWSLEDCLRLSLRREGSSSLPIR